MPTAWILQLDPPHLTNAVVTHDVARTCLR